MPLYIFMFLGWALQWANAAPQTKVSPSQRQTEQRILLGIFEDQEHLFPLLMPAEAIANNLDESKKSFVVHFRDSFKKFPDPHEFKHSAIRSELRQRNLSQQHIHPVKGTMTYVGFFKARYAYDLEVNGKVFTHVVRIHFKNPVGSDLQEFATKIRQAESIWNQSIALNQFYLQFGLDFQIQFRFELVKDAKAAHFSVDVADKTRGPYYVEWARNWTDIAIAHEIGHMLGLGDEYETLSGADDCLDQSLMCESWRGQLMGHHFYHVIKRLF